MIIKVLLFIEHRTKTIKYYVIYIYTVYIVVKPKS